MPNHIKNKLILIGTIEQIQEVFEKHNTFLEAELNKTHNGDFKMTFVYYDGWHFNYEDKLSEYSTLTFYDVHEFQNLYYSLTAEELTIK